MMVTDLVLLEIRALRPLSSRKVILFADEVPRFYKAIGSSKPSRWERTPAESKKSRRMQLLPAPRGHHVKAYGPENTVMHVLVEDVQRVVATYRLTCPIPSIQCAAPIAAPDRTVGPDRSATASIRLGVSRALCAGDRVKSEFKHYLISN